ncbi:MAG: FkbM family methyltransferase [Planctomycetota bacterium]
MLRQRLVAVLTRLYPLYSGCGTFANSKIIQKLSGRTSELGWATITGGARALVPLDDYIGRAMYFVGDLDRKVSWVCKRIVRPGDNVVDIGANLGLIALQLARLVGPSGRVHAFEPIPQLLGLLEQSIVRNGLRNIHLHRVALGAEDGELELWVPEHHAGRASFVRMGNATSKIRVPIKRLAEFSTQPGMDAIRLLKIDVEGFEPQVFNGARSLFESRPPDAILFELNDTDVAPQHHPTIEFLRELGYRFLSIPKCYFRMRLVRYDPAKSEPPYSHDFLAVRVGATGDEIAARVGA